MTLKTGKLNADIIPGQKAAAPRERKKVRDLEVVVANVIPETPDTVTMILFTGNEFLDYRPGHFLTIDPHQFPSLDRFTRYLEDIKGRKESPRAYSLASAPDEKHLSITIKAEEYVSGTTLYPPLLSPLLVRRVLPGSRMVVSGFTGPYTLPEDIASRTRHLVHICAGSGVVPNYSMIKYALRNHPELRHTLVLSNRTWDDVIYKKEWDYLQQSHPDRLRVVHALTREEDATRFGAGVRQGRVSAELLRELLREPGDAEFFICGPGITPHDRKRARDLGQEPAMRFMETVLALLGDMGVDNARIHRETYG
ncbi:MAG: oxidoreductase [Nitrospirota bacterium]|nr:oxidoreductase [Nitrospirota bacterium]